LEGQAAIVVVDESEGGDSDSRMGGGIGQGAERNIIFRAPILSQKRTEQVRERAGWKPPLLQGTKEGSGSANPSSLIGIGFSSGRNWGEGGGLQSSGVPQALSVAGKKRVKYAFINEKKNGGEGCQECEEDCQWDSDR